MSAERGPADQGMAREGPANGAAKGAEGKARRFTFSQQFDPSKEAAEAYRSPQRDEAERRRREELARMREEGYAEGHEAGLAAARAELNAAIAATLDRLAQRLDELGPSEEATGHMLARQSIEIARAVGRRLASRLVDMQPEVEVEALVGECIGQLRDEAQIVVTLSPPLAQALEERLQELAAKHGFTGKLLVQEDPAMAATDARLAWSEGSASRSRQDVLREIDLAVERYLQGRGLKGLEPAPTDPAAAE